MKIITARYPEEALYSALILLRNCGVESTSRNGRVIEIPGPVTTEYLYPYRRVMLDPDRDCNPFLHFFESLWMLAGSNELEFMTQFTQNMANFSDDGRTLNGAYGYRWRKWFDYDQLEFIVNELRDNPHSRRCVLGMWDPHSDLIGGKKSKDVPCNTQVFFRIDRGSLTMTVCNRSNDMIWGAYGANLVHFSFLHEYVACRIARPMGPYYQVSNNLHLYPDIPIAGKMLKLAGYNPPSRYDWPAGGAPKVSPSEPLIRWAGNFNLFNEDLSRLMAEGLEARDYETRFFRIMVKPMAEMWLNRKDPEKLNMAASSMFTGDWKVAALEWAERRQKGAAND